MGNVFMGILEKWRKKTSKEKWQFVYNMGAVVSESIGVTVYKTMDNYWFSYFSEVMSLLYFVTSFYTVWIYFKQNEYLRGLQSTGAIGIVFACLVVQIQTLGPRRYQINNLLNFSGKYYYVDDDHTTKYNVVRKHLVDRLIRNTIIVIPLIFVAFAMFGITAVYMLLIERVRITFLGIELPFFERDSDIGFIVNTCMQTMIAALGMAACTAVEIGACLVNNAIYSVPPLMRVEIDELDSEIHLYGMTLLAKAHLRNIFMKVQDYEMLVQQSIDLYYTRLFFGPFLFTYSISISICGQLFLGYPTGFGCAAGNYLLLLICCHLGENMEEAKNQIEIELYNMPWYSLPATYQKQVQSAIHMIQHGGSLTIGPFSKLNMETAADLCTEKHLEMAIMHVVDARTRLLEFKVGLERERRSLMKCKNN